MLCWRIICWFQGLYSIPNYSCTICTFHRKLMLLYSQYIFGGGGESKCLLFFPLSLSNRCLARRITTLMKTSHDVKRIIYLLRFCDVTRYMDRYCRFQCVVWGFHNRCSSLQGFMTPCWLLISFRLSRRVILVPPWRWRQQAYPKHR